MLVEDFVGADFVAKSNGFRKNTVSDAGFPLKLPNGNALIFSKFLNARNNFTHNCRKFLTKSLQVSEIFPTFATETMIHTNPTLVFAVQV